MDRASKKTIIVFTALAIVFIFAIFWIAPRNSVPSARPRVTVTIFPLYDIVRNIAGSFADVTLILPPGAEPHSFEPSPSVVRKVSSSAVVYAIGHGLDDWIDPISKTADVPKTIVDSGILLRENSDPHYWLTIPNAILIVDTVAADLGRRFPGEDQYFKDNAAAYRARLEKLDDKIRPMLAGATNRRIVTFHDAWYYFADAYGLEIVGTFEPTPGREPTPRALGELRKTIVHNQVHTVFAEPLFSDAAIEAFARDQGLAIAKIDDLGGTPGRESYEELMLSNAKIIAESL